MTRILGIDPGSRITGFGVIDCQVGQIRYVESGLIKPSTETLPSRLHQIYFGIKEIVERVKPDIAVVEKVFISVNPQSALMLGQARGAAICACGASNVKICEYAAKQIKSTVTGTGMASKEQVQYMVKMLLGLDKKLRVDEADALAGAITHFQYMTGDEFESGPVHRQVPAGI